MAHAPLGITTGRIFETHVQTTDLERATGLPVGGPLVLPAEWLRLLPPRSRSASPRMFGD